MESEGNSGIGFFIAFFVGILILAVITSGEDGERRPLFGTGEERATSSDSSLTFERTYIQSVDTETPESLSNDEVERALARTYDELEDLTEDLREARIWGEHSPYEGAVTLRRGNVYTEDVDSEYLIITASYNNERPIDITNWAFESYVTGRRRWVEEGTRIYTRGRVNTRSSIWLEPGERAYVISGESPVGVSFHENLCTGYLSEHQDFVPYLNRSCPRPLDEMRRYSVVQLKDDDCYEFVEDIFQCDIPKEEDIEDADLSRACETFLEDNLSYNACVRNHRYEPFFDEGDWYLYLRREEDLWRPEREIIKLTDSMRRTVDVIEY